MASNNPNSEAMNKDQSPDLIRQQWPAVIEEPVPRHESQLMPMVGLGGAAGCIQALTAFFKVMPPDSGMAFVVFLHLSPTHVSTLAETLSRKTTMPVVQAVDGERVEANKVYVIPPNKHLLTVDGHLQLCDQECDRGRQVAVDVFFRSLADTYDPNSADVVLSGDGGAGALGINRIKERGGLTIAQNPNEAEHSEMPQASIENGMVDWVLDISLMPDRLVEYFKHRSQLRLPPDQGPQLEPQQPLPTEDGETALRDVLIFLRMRTGHDFSYYKRATILCRIARRMQVNRVNDLPTYLKFLQTHPAKAVALLNDLLICVTNFFRDCEVFESLEKCIPDKRCNNRQIKLGD